MERIKATSSWNDAPSSSQLQRIYWYTKLLSLDFTEADMPANRLEARNIIYQLRARLKRKNRRR